MSESTCFGGVGIGAVGKLQHSHHYYSQVVPRYGGRWENASGDADFVVVPFNIAEVCKSNAAHRRSLAIVLSARRPRLVDESFLADSISQRRMLSASEIKKRAVHIPVALVQQWTEEIGRPVKTRSNQLVARDVTHNRDTQTDLPPTDSAVEEDEEMELENLEDNLKAIAVRTAERAAACGGKESTTYYVSQQGCLNSEMREKIFAYLHECDTQLEWFAAQARSAQESLIACLTTGRGAVAEYHTTHAMASPEMVTKFSLAKEWSLAHPPAKHPLRFYPLHNYLHLLQLIRTTPMARPKLDDILAALIPVWDAYMGTHTSIGAPSVLGDLVSGHLLSFTDSLGELKQSCVEPLDKRVRETQRGVKALDDKKAAAQLEKDYPRALRHEMEAVALLEETLTAVHRFQRTLTAGTVDVEMTSNALLSFKSCRTDIDELKAKKADTKTKIESDKNVIVTNQRNLLERLQSLEAQKRREADEFEKKIDANSKRMSDTFQQIDHLNHEMKTLTETRRLVCEEAATRCETLSAEISWCEQRLGVVSDLESWTDEAAKHVRASFEVIKLTQDTYEELQSIVDNKGACDSALQDMIAHGAKTHLNVLEQYCQQAGASMTGLATKRAAMDVHQRAVELQLKLADSSLDHTVQDMEKLCFGLREEHTRIENQHEGIAKRLAAQISLFDGYSALVLRDCGHDFTHPTTQMRTLLSASELSTRAVLTSHIEKEKQAMKSALAGHLESTVRA